MQHRRDFVYDGGVRLAWTVVLAAGCAFRPGITGDGSGGSAARDAQDDAPLDGDNAAPPAVVAFASASSAGTDGLSYTFSVPAGNDRLLLVSAQTGSTCPPTGATISTVTYGGAPLTRVAAVFGVPNCATDTRTEVWELIAPPVGSATVRVTLSQTEPTLHSIAIAVAGVDPTNPVSGQGSNSGSDVTSSVTVASAPSDLVVSFVGQGSYIDSPTTGTLIVLDNVSSSTSLDNTAASQLPGATSVAASWQFGSSDNWQEVVVALRP